MSETSDKKFMNDNTSDIDIWMTIHQTQMMRYQMKHEQITIYQDMDDDTSDENGWAKHQIKSVWMTIHRTQMMRHHAKHAKAYMHMVQERSKVSGDDT